MRITILTLFPNIIHEYINSSIIKNAIQKGLCEINVVNFRDFSKSNNKKVDDYQFGGGPGMVLMLQPIIDAIKFYKRPNSKIILLTPTGNVFNSKIANDFSKLEDIIIISGHYEGFDERILNYIDYEISIGDFVLTGGELPSLLIVDSIIRLIPNVINKNSLANESFENNLLDYPVYTKPYNFENYKVPDVLLTGNHKEIEKYRHDSRLEKTKKNRIDLYEKYICKKGNKNE